MKWWTTLGLDLIVVLLFATIGRLSHGEAADPLGILTTAWPFVIALAGVTVALIGMQRPTDTWLNGLFVWAGTLGFGMWIRANWGEGVQASFVVVAGIFLGALMIGWRVIAARRSTQRATRPAKC
ncbi:MAG: DUF3054 domain-containing protein [Micropruina glycogenica]